MIARLLALSLLLLPCLVRAAEITVGWKMPVEMFVPGFPEGTGLRKLEKAPGESAFFQPGAELWDVSKVCEWPYQKLDGRLGPYDPRPVDMKPWQGKWVVWNARSGTFVARGALLDVLAAQRALGFEEQHRVIRSTLELERPGKPVRSLTLVSRSGLEATMSTDDMALELTVSSSLDSSFAYLEVVASWKGKEEGTRWHLRNNVTIQNNSRHLLASQGTGESVWKLFVTTRGEGLGGSLGSGTRWIEAAGKLRLWPMRNRVFCQRDPLESSLREPLEKDREVASFSMICEPPPEWAVIEAPEELRLRGFAEGPVFDLKEPLKKAKGADFSRPGFFAGYDLLASRVLLIGDARTVGLVEDLLDDLLNDEADPPLWISTNEASGGWGVSMSPSNKVWLVRLDASGEEDLSFTVEPFRDPDDSNKRVIDLRMCADFVAGDIASGWVETAVTLEMGKPMEVARCSTADGREVAMEITARIVPFNR